MAFDGICIRALVHEFNNKLLNGHLSKIAQTENEELLLTVKNNKTQYRLLLSANASMPVCYLTETNKPSPMNAYNFCMVLRKHLSNAKISSITQPSLERIIDIKLEHLNEMGDPAVKHLMIEIMGKHSNIIFIDDDNRIIDSIKRVPPHLSSVRTVLPMAEYFITSQDGKSDPFSIGYGEFIQKLTQKDTPAYKALYSNLIGLSPASASDICLKAGIDTDIPVSQLKEDFRFHLYNVFENYMQSIVENRFEPHLYVDENGKPVEFSAFSLLAYKDHKNIPYDSMSRLVEDYYSKRLDHELIRQKSSQLRKTTQTALERAARKYELQLNQLKDTEKMDKLRLYGELLTAYAYEIPKEACEYEALNYYDNTIVKISLDKTKTAYENANSYYSRYNKLKRTKEALTVQIKETSEEIEHLESVLTSLELAINEADLNMIRKELVMFGYIKAHHDERTKKTSVKLSGKPLHYISRDGYHIYVGRNNFQNDELTFKFALGNDIWFHAKGIAGSHVILKTEGKNKDEIPDSSFEDAASLAAYYSKAGEYSKTDIDYTLKKNLHKPNGARPGFVVYYTNYSMVASAQIKHLKKIDD